MRMKLNQLGNVFEVEKNKMIDDKALGFHSLKQFFTPLQFLSIVDIEH